MASMTEWFSALLLSVLSQIFNPGAQQMPGEPVEPVKDQPKIEFNCSEVRWLNGSGMQGKNFDGTVEVDCTFKAIHGGGFVELNRYLLDQAVHAPEVKQVHAGPISETFEKMPSTYYDVTTLMGKEDGDSALIRQDMHIATDLAARLAAASVSKSIQATGNAKYIKKYDLWSDIRSTSTKGQYTAKVRAHAIMEKPWFLGNDAFENLIRDQVKKKAEETERKVIEEVAQHL